MRAPGTGDPKNILVVRLSAIGDIVFASPLIEALHRRYPDGRVSWLVQPESASLLAHHPLLAEVIVWPRSQWRELWKARRWLDLLHALRGYRAMLRGRKFDLVIDAQGLLKSGLLAWLSGAPQRIGLGSKEGSGWLMTRVIEKGADGTRIGSEYLHLARNLDLPVDRFQMHVAVDEAAQLHARDLAARYRLDTGYAVVSPFTTRPQKHWPEQRWAELLPAMERSFSLPVIILGGPSDEAAGKRIAGMAGGRVICLAGRTSLNQAAALISQARLLIGVDTGLTHMGIAFGRPTLALFGSTCPYLDTTRRNARVIYHPLPCSPCRRRPVCNGAFTCMADIRVEEVLHQAADLIDLDDAPGQRLYSQ